MKITPFILADQEHVKTVQVEGLVLKNHQDTIQDLSIALEWSVKTVPNIIHVQLGYSSVCMVGTKKRDGSSQKLIFAGALSLLQSFKGGANGFPGTVVTLWDMGSTFYSKWAVMQWTHPSSWTATKCKGCQYAGRLLHLYSMLQESELCSYFEIQKWMWSYAVTCCADYIRLLVGRGMNICHEVWSLSTVIPIQYSTNTRSCCSLET